MEQKVNAMIGIEFTQEEIEQLNYERYHHPHRRVQRKMSVVYLKSQGLKHKEIERLENICGNTQLEYLREYQEVAKIEEITGIKKKRESVRVFLKKNGFEPRKVGTIPAKADVEKQEKFLTEELQPRINEAQAGKRTLFLWTQRTLSTPHF